MDDYEVQIFFYDEMAIIVSTSVLKDSAQKFSPAI